MAKKSRKQLLNEQDAFVQAAEHGARWIGDNKKGVIAALVLLFLGVAGLWGGSAFMKTRDRTASNLLAAALEIRDAAIVEEEGKADPEAKPPTFASEKLRGEATLAALQQVIDNAKGSGVGALARFYLAAQHEKMGDAATAQTVLQGLISDLAADDNLFFLAVERLAYMQEAGGDLEAAIASWAKLAGRDAAFYADSATFHQARLYAAKGESGKAKELFEKVVADFAKSPAATAAKERLALLDGPVAAAVAPLDAPTAVDPGAQQAQNKDADQ